MFAIGLFYCAFCLTQIFIPFCIFMLDKSLAGCHNFEPSALPLPWAFCRSTTGQSRALSGAESVIGRLGDFPVSRRFSALILKFQWAKPFLATTVPKLPNATFQSLGGVRMPLMPQECRKPPHNAKQDALRFLVVVRTETGYYWQRNSCQKNQRLLLRFLKLFGSIDR